jgi:fumarate reductase subunit C
MKSIKKALLYGFLVWLIPFIAAILLSSVRKDNRPLFESIMPVVITISVVPFLILYFSKLQAHFLKEAVLLGIIWLAISLILDLFLFMEGPMKMSFADYMMDIGLTYLMIPTISVGFGYLLEKRRI